MSSNYNDLKVEHNYSNVWRDDGNYTSCMSDCDTLENQDWMPAPGQALCEGWVIAGIHVRPVPDSEPTLKPGEWSLHEPKETPVAIVETFWVDAMTVSQQESF